MLDINKTPNDTEMVIALKGRLDTLTAPQLEEELNSATEGASCLVFDFTELEYISSAGLRVLLTFEQELEEQGKPMRLCKSQRKHLNLDFSCKLI